MLTISETEIVELQELADVTRDQRYLETLNSKISILIDLLEITAQGALVQSRFLNLSQMDAPSKSFFSLERKNVYYIAMVIAFTAYALKMGRS